MTLDRDVPALTRLGKQLLGGEGEAFDPMRGSQLLEAAAREGGAEAAALMAVLCGAGVCRPQDWNQALDYLQLAAERGSPSAQAQLELLSADLGRVAMSAPTGGRDHDVWRRLRDAVRIADWLEPPERQVISESPRIRRMDGFLPSEVCRWLVERARGQRLATFLVYLNDDYEGGQTHFPRVGLSHRGAAGSALFFANVDTGGRPDPSTLHAGLAPTSGETWLLSQWIRDRTPAGR